LSFVGPQVDRQLRAEDLAEFRWARGDVSRLGAAFFVTCPGREFEFLLG
jgi:hypothetical protein